MRTNLWTRWFEFTAARVPYLWTDVRFPLDEFGGSVGRAPAACHQLVTQTSLGEQNCQNAARLQADHIMQPLNAAENVRENWCSFLCATTTQVWFLALYNFCVIVFFLISFENFKTCFSDTRRIQLIGNRTRTCRCTLGFAHSPKSISFKLWSSSISRFSYKWEKWCIYRQRNPISCSVDMFGLWSYWFQVSVRISLAVHVGHGRHNLSEKHPGLLLGQTILGYDVIKQLPTYAVLREEGFFNYITQKNVLNK